MLFAFLEEEEEKDDEKEMMDDSKEQNGPILRENTGILNEADVDRQSGSNQRDNESGSNQRDNDEAKQNESNPSESINFDDPELDEFIGSLPDISMADIERFENGEDEEETESEDTRFPFREAILRDSSILKDLKD